MVGVLHHNECTCVHNGKKITNPDQSGLLLPFLGRSWPLLGFPSPSNCKISSRPCKLGLSSSSSSSSSGPPSRGTWSGSTCSSSSSLSFFFFCFSLPVPDVLPPFPFFFSPSFFCLSVSFFGFSGGEDDSSLEEPYRGGNAWLSVADPLGPKI